MLSLSFGIGLFMQPLWSKKIHYVSRFDTNAYLVQTPPASRYFFFFSLLNFLYSRESLLQNFNILMKIWRDNIFYNLAILKNQSFPQLPNISSCVWHILTFIAWLVDHRSVIKLKKIITFHQQASHCNRSSLNKN